MQNRNKLVVLVATAWSLSALPSALAQPEEPADPAATAAADHSCTSDSDCEPGESCAASRSECIPRPDGSFGGACYGNWTCDPGLVCERQAMVCARAADGAAGGACYGNGTCDQGLACSTSSRICEVKADAPPPEPASPPAPAEGGAPVADLTATSSTSSAAGEEISRDGLVIGLSAGIGQERLEDEDAVTGLESNFVLGAMVSPRLAVLWDASVFRRGEQGVDVVAVSSLGALRGWVSSRFWLQGGLGIGKAFVSIDNDDEEGDLESEFAAIAMVAAGFDIVQKDGYTVDLKLRAAATEFVFPDADDAEVRVDYVSLLAGVTWY